MVSSAVTQSSKKNPLEFCIYLDISHKLDPPDLPKLTHVTYKLYYGPQLPISVLTNFMYSQSTGEIIMYAADDIVFRTNHWDEIVLGYLPDPHNVVALLSANDGSPNFPTIATHGFVTRKMSESLGYLLPPYFLSNFCDTWLTSVARQANILISAPELLIEHMHPSWNKANDDETYAKGRSAVRHHELQIYYYLKTAIRLREIRKLKKAKENNL